MRDDISDVLGTDRLNATLTGMLGRNIVNDRDISHTLWDMVSDRALKNVHNKGYILDEINPDPDSNFQRQRRGVEEQIRDRIIYEKPEEKPRVIPVDPEDEDPEPYNKRTARRR